MERPQSPPSRPTRNGANRWLVFLLLGAIGGVLLVGFRLLSGGGGSVTSPEPAADLATALGAFYLPGDFETQDFIFLAGEPLAAQHPEVLTAVVRAAAEEVRLIILCSSPRGLATVDSLLAAAGLDSLPVTVQPAPVQTMWLRDFGPFTVTDLQGRRSMAEFHCGTDRRAGRLDDDLPSFLATQLDLVLLGNPLQLEGGQVLTDGRGFGVLSRRAGDEVAEQGGSDPEGAARTVAAMLGFEHVLLLETLAGEAGGHVDLCCSFLAADQVVVGRLDTHLDPENAARLDRIATDLDGLQTLAGPLRVARVDQPQVRDGILRSYTPVVFANGVVLVPVYPDCCPDLDAQALELYRRLLPDRKVVGIDVSGLARGGGALRDITLNVPVGGPLEGTLP